MTFNIVQHEQRSTTDNFHTRGQIFFYRTNERLMGQNMKTCLYQFSRNKMRAWQLGYGYLDIFSDSIKFTGSQIDMIQLLFI